MLRRVGLLSVIIAAVTMCFAPTVAADWKFTCLDDKGGICWWILTAGGTPPAVPAGQTVYQPPVYDPCVYHLNDLPPDDPAWGSNDPAKGRLWKSVCVRATVFANEDGGNRFVRYEHSRPYYVPDGQFPSGSPYIPPEAVLARAEGRFNIPAPDIRLGPDASQIAVQIPVWLAVANAEPITTTAEAGDTVATITAVLSRTDWDMGEPYDPNSGSTATMTVSCNGPGTIFQQGMSPANPPCGYTYRWRSLPERTAGTEIWRIIATATWDVNWQVTNSEGEIMSGSETVTVTDSYDVSVREWRAALANPASDN